MTNHDPGRFSHEGDPAWHPDIPNIEDYMDSNGDTWLATDIEPVRSSLLGKFTEHVVTVSKRYRHLDMSNETQRRIVTDNLAELVEPEASQIDMVVGQWVVMRGLDHFVFNGIPHTIPQDTLLCGQYIELAVCPHYQYDYEQKKLYETLPNGIALAVIGLRYVSEQNGFAIVQGLPEHEQVLLTLHGKDVQLSRLDPVKIDDDGISNDKIISAWNTYSEVDTSGGYSLN